MPFPIENKLVITVTSSALFDMTESNEVFETQGVEAYRKYQKDNLNNTLEKGVAFPFISRFLSLNKIFKEEQPVEVILFSKNSPDAGNRAMRSLLDYGLDISRFVFTSGLPNFQYLPAYNSTLFLTSNSEDTQAAIAAGYAAGTVINKTVLDDENDPQLRLAFDFDSVLAGDESERIYKENGMEEYRKWEKENSANPLSAGPLEPLLARLSKFREMEKLRVAEDPSYKPVIQTSIVTARNAPAHERVLTTLEHWGIEVDQLFFLGGMEKARVLEILKPHIFFDDQMVHLENLFDVPAAHIPFGVANQKSE